MLSRNLMVGVSVLAFAAGTAAAQTTTSGTNQSTVNQSGTNNSSDVDNAGSGNDRNQSNISQNGNQNTAIVRQIGDDNISRIRQTGNNHFARHIQDGNRNTAETVQDGSDHRSENLQRGNDNLVVVQQTNTGNSSTVRQGTNGAVSNNSVRVDQFGESMTSEVDQTPLTGSGVAVTNNTVGVRQTGAGNFSSINQNSRGNSATVFQFEGGTAQATGTGAGSTTAARNESRIRQGNSAATSTTTTLSNNRAGVFMAGQGNSSTVEQDGTNNFADVTMSGGGTETADGGTRREGNQSTLLQFGRGHTALIVASRDRNGNTGGQGNISRVVQGDAATVGAANQGANARTEMFQRGVLDVAEVRQVNGPQGQATTTARPFASVSQRGVRNTVTVTQRGDNFAEVTQGLGALSTVRVDQTDAGDFGGGTNTGDPNNPFDNSTSPGTRGFNTALIAQFGDRHELSVTQNAVQASATVFQERFRVSGSTTNTRNNSVTVNQGANALSLGTAPVNNSRLTANIVQGGAFNSTTVRQEGNSLNARVEQRGAFRLSNTDTSQNLVTIEQRGSDQSARAFQSVNVGRSGTDAPAATQSQTSDSSVTQFQRGSGSQSPEIQIIQQTSGNSATVEQYGRGQFARIEQTGSRNVAGIFQREGATNAVAVIRQSGNDNSYRIEQTQAGQFIVVTQTGNNNSSTNVVQGGPSGGSAGTGGF